MQAEIVSKRKWARWLGVLCLFLPLSVAFAAQGPIEMLKGVTDAVLAQLRSHQDELKAHPDRIYGIAEHSIIPHVDFVEMGRWIAGRNAWKKASESDQAAFIAAFKTLVVRTYATSLLQYTDQTVEFMPLKSSTEKERLQVTSYINGGDRGPIKMDYRLIKQGAEWLVYDIVIEGVSLLKGYQAQFSADVRQQGLNYVTNKIKAHNGQGRSRQSNSKGD
ncbi:MAG TPA: ABC transporter substrate-binding protein [Gammaproteobacteria bacterium]|nr:ABC transporter substrate-binding protein [Gammaproteobacteria bacterium]